MTREKLQDAPLELDTPYVARFAYNKRLADGAILYVATFNRQDYSFFANDLEQKQGFNFEGAKNVKFKVLEKKGRLYVNFIEFATAPAEAPPPPAPSAAQSAPPLLTETFGVASVEEACKLAISIAKALEPIKLLLGDGFSNTVNTVFIQCKNLPPKRQTEVKPQGENNLPF